MEVESSTSQPSGESSDPFDSSASHHVVLIAGHNRWEWVFLVICISNITLLTTCSLLSLKNCPEEVFRNEAVENLELVICITACISLFFALYGIFKEHQHEIYMHTLILALSFAFSWIGFFLDHCHCLYLLKLITNGVGSIMCVLGFLLAWKATHAPDWIEFRIIGISDVLMAMYNQQCCFLVLLKVDSIFMVVFALYSSELAYSFSSKMWWIYQGEILVYAFLSWLCGRLTIFLESKRLMYGFYMFSSVYPAFIVYELYLVVNSQHWGIVLYSIITLGVLGVISKIYLIYQMYKSGTKFGYGLNRSSFQELVLRNSSNLLTQSRSSVLY